MSDYNYSTPQPHEVYSWLMEEKTHLYGVKTIDEENFRCIVVCKTKEIAEDIEYYLENHRDLFFSFADTEKEQMLIDKKEFYIVTDLNENLDDNAYISVYASQLDDMIEFFKDYITTDEMRKEIVEIEIINNEYIDDVLD